jgi:two-component system chemotaxis sensor kinase CheA
VRVKIDRDALLAMFLAETEENLAAMEQAILALERRKDDAEAVQTLFRLSHTLKGNASTLGFAELVAFTHALEDVLDRLRSRELVATDDVATLLLGCVDALRALVDAARSGEPAAPQHVALGERLLGLVEEASHAAPWTPAPAGSPTAQAAEAAPVPGSPGRSRTLRVDVATLDKILDLTGEIAVARGRLSQVLDADDAQGIALAREIHREADRLHADLQELVMRVRLVPVGPLFASHARTVRDAAAAQGKQVRFVLTGEDVEVDTKVVDYVQDPLTHLLRNAIAHGIEEPAAREALGKDPSGSVRLHAFRESGAIVIELEDDGAGLDRERILAAARERGLVSGDGGALSDADVYALIFEPGFSTSRSVTDLSGRGVGLDVVRRNVEALRGTVSVATRPGQGTTFTIRLPLSLAIIQGFGVETGGETFVVPLEAVVECVSHAARDRDRATGVINLRGEAVPYIRLRHRLGVGGRAPAREQVLVVHHRERRVGLVADTLLGQAQTVVKPLGPLFRRLPGLAGSTILGDGRVGLLLDVAALVEEADAEHEDSALKNSALEKEETLSC